MLPALIGYSLGCFHHRIWILVTNKLIPHPIPRRHAVGQEAISDHVDLQRILDQHLAPMPGARQL
jgi:hypothetical protein